MIDFSHARWRKSSRSGGGNTCVEVANLSAATIAVRDSTNPSGPQLTFSRAAWNALFTEIKADALDLR